MTKQEAIEILNKNAPKSDPRLCALELCSAIYVVTKALQEPGLSYEEIMVGDIIKNFGCEYEVHSISHIKDELFISAYRIGGEEE